MQQGRLAVTDLYGDRTVVVEAPSQLTIGRHTRSDLVVANPEVSRLHAAITTSDDARFVLRDLRSAYGTFVNGRRLEGDRRLTHGDRIRLGTDGGAHLTFTLHDAAREARRAAPVPSPPTGDPRVILADLRAAYETQQALLPDRRAAGDFYEACGEMVPCRSVRGDFFDYARPADGSFAFVLGDVAGKGSPAALLAARAQEWFAAEAARLPAEAIAGINRAFWRRPIEGRFVTMFIGLLLADGRLRYCNAGHNPPVLLHRGDAVPLDAGGLAVGMFPDAVYGEGDVTCDPGDRLVVFSDGVSEAMGREDEEFGDRRLGELLPSQRGLSLGASVDALLEAARTFTRAGPASDDMTVMMVEYRPS